MNYKYPSSLNGLTFNRLRAANLDRDKAVWNEIHNWLPSDWAVATAGEIGEACNFIKKLRRGITEDKGKQIVSEIGKELADAVIYLDLLAYSLGIDLSEVVRSKFNEVSDRVGCDVKL